MISSILKRGMKLLIHSQTSLVEVWEWISNLILHYTGHVITYPCWAESYAMLVKGVFGKYNLSVIYVSHDILFGMVTKIVSV